MNSPLLNNNIINKCQWIKTFSLGFNSLVLDINLTYLNSQLFISPK